MLSGRQRSLHHSPPIGSHAERYSMRIPIEVAGLGTGVTVEISASGVWFELELSAHEMLPRNLDFTLLGSDFRLSCGGRVVRCERRELRLFVAVTIDRMQVSRRDDERRHRSREEAARPGSS
jgi:hypothetical protein